MSLTAIARYASVEQRMIGRDRYDESRLQCGIGPTRKSLVARYRTLVAGENSHDV